MGLEDLQRGFYLFRACKGPQCPPSALVANQPGWSGRNIRKVWRLLQKLDGWQAYSPALSFSTPTSTRTSTWVETSVNLVNCSTHPPRLVWTSTKTSTPTELNLSLAQLSPSLFQHYFWLIHFPNLELKEIGPQIVSSSLVHTVSKVVLGRGKGTILKIEPLKFC